MQIKQVSVFIENKPGTLFEITNVLSDGGIDMRALCVAESSEFGILRLIVSDSAAASAVLTKAGYVHNLTHVLAIAIPDTTGGMSGIVKILSDAGINIEYAYAFLAPTNGNAYMVFRVENNDQAERILTEKGYTLASEQELSAL